MKQIEARQKLRQKMNRKYIEKGLKLDRKQIETRQKLD